ncbi:MAG: serine hydrolase domain-containing protein [Myxococcota bacterium]
MAFASGAHAEVPAGLIAKLKGDVITVIEPDQRAECWLVEVIAPDAPSAIAAAWKAVGLSAGTVQQSVDPPARDGWELVHVETYAADAEKRVAQALARKKGERIWVSLTRGLPGDLEKRYAQLASFLTSLKVPGMVEVDLSTVTPKELGAQVAELDEFIETALEDSGTPGLEIAVIEGGKLAYAMGYGVRELGKKEKVDADTLMMIGSVTKSMTTLMMATLVDEKKLAWDQKVVEVDPSFTLGDPALSQSLKVEELVCACAGLPRRDLPLLVEFEKKHPEDVLKELALMKPSTKLHETFQYQNHMVAAGGYIAAHALDPKTAVGPAYDKAMKKRIFEPLGMKRTTLDLDVAKKDRNHASPHAQNLQGEHHLVPYDQERFASFVRPSGGVWSSANEMARYVMDELSKGALDNGKRVASEASLTHRWEQQVAISTDVHYGLGFVVSKWKGLRHITHGGATAGFATQLSFYPEKGLGIVLLSNGTGGHLIEGAIRTKVLELWFGIDDKSQDQLTAALNSQRQQIAQLAERSVEPKDEEMTGFVGIHDNADLGAFEIKKTKEGYLLDTGVYKSKLLRHTDPSGKTALLLVQGPLTGMTLEPTAEAGGSFEMNLAQEHYVFKKRG